MHVPDAQMCSRWTPVDPNAFPLCSKVLSLDACRSKCVQCLECVHGFEDGLIQIWAKRCPNEAIWKQINHSSGKVHLGSKVARFRSGQEGVQIMPYGSKSVIVSGGCIWVRKLLGLDLDEKVSK